MVNGIQDKMPRLFKLKRVFTCRGWGKKNTFGIQLATPIKDYFHIATDEAKACVMESLQHGHWHARKGLPGNYLEGLLSERLDETNTWVVKGRRRNEVLDCAVYAYAAGRSIRGYGEKQNKEIQKAVFDLQ